MFPLERYEIAMALPPNGRGARSNVSSRDDSQQREGFDDGWTPEDVDPPKLTTTVSPMKSKTVIARNDSPDIGFDKSINPYRGCEHGCSYMTDRKDCDFPEGVALPLRFPAKGERKRYQ